MAVLRLPVTRVYARMLLVEVTMVLSEITITAVACIENGCQSWICHERRNT